MTRIAAVILAAGASRRLGRPKQLARHEGTTLLRAIAARLCATSCDAVGVVLGAGADSIVPTLDGLPVEVVYNAAWSEGIASSIRGAVAWAERASCDALLVSVGDQPRLTATHVERMLGAYHANRTTIASRYDGRLGVPAIFLAERFPELAALQGDHGARHLLVPGTLAIDWPDGAIDIDVPADLALLTT